MKKVIILQFDEQGSFTATIESALSISLCNLLQEFGVSGYINVLHTDENDELIASITKRESSLSPQKLDDCIDEINRFILKRMYNKVALVSLVSVLPNDWLFHVYASIINTDQRDNTWRIELINCINFGKMLKENEDLLTQTLKLYDNSKKSAVIVRTITTLVVAIYDIFKNRLYTN